MAFTHLQPAEPTTVGYRLASYAQDLLIDYHYVQFLQENFVAKGMKGAVGTAASYNQILKGTDISSDEMEKMVMEDLDLEPILISTQVLTRK